MIAQSLKQTKKQFFNWKVLFGLKKIEWVPTCESCGKEGEGNFCCPKCDGKDIWTKDILAKGNVIHKCK